MATAKRDYYEVLGVPRGADAGAIKDAFRKLAMRLQEIDAADAVLGAEIGVPTLDGEVSVKVPPGTQPDSQLRLRGKGLPRFGARGRGDLYLRLAVRLPERPGAEERALWQRLRALRLTRS